MTRRKRGTGVKQEAKRTTDLSCDGSRMGAVRGLRVESDK
jgi:hypothetical protein